MLATTVGIDRTIEWQIRRRIAGDDGFRRFDAHLGALGNRRFLVPAVVFNHRTIGGETVVRVGRGAAATGRRWRLHEKHPVTVCTYSTPFKTSRPAPFGTF
ncbi:hypothetical protein D3C71_1732250 [compost metagenome]